MDFSTLAIIGAALFVYVRWAAHIGAFAFSNDAWAHLNYIRFVAFNLRLPRPDAGWVMYHPPLYYLLTGMLYRLVHQSADPIPFIRGFSLICFTAFLLYGTATLRLFVKDRPLYLLTAGMLAAWPAGIMLAARIDSDVLLYALAAASFYYLVRWHRERKPETLTACLLITGIGIITRSNIFVLLPPIAFIIGFHLRRSTVSPQYFMRWRFALALIFLVVAFGVNLGRPAYMRLVEHKPLDLIVSNKDHLLSESWLLLSNEMHDFTRLDAEKYFRTPFYLPGEDQSGRRNFWVVLFKSSLFGEFPFKQRHLAFWLTVALTGFIACVALPPIFYSDARVETALPCLALATSAVAGLMYNRWHIPAPCSADFRYIYFAVIPLIALFGYHLQWAKESRQRWFVTAGWIIGAAMILLSLAVYMGQL